MQMSGGAEAAAGRPFRRVITLFPSMTPGDTTVTFHLAQAPPDSKGEGGDGEEGGEGDEGGKGAGGHSGKTRRRERKD